MENINLHASKYYYRKTVLKGTEHELIKVRNGEVVNIEVEDLSVSEQYEVIWEDDEGNRAHSELQTHLENAYNTYLGVGVS